MRNAKNTTSYPRALHILIFTLQFSNIFSLPHLPQKRAEEPSTASSVGAPVFDERNAGYQSLSSVIGNLSSVSSTKAIAHRANSTISSISQWYQTEAEVTRTDTVPCRSGVSRFRLRCTRPPDLTRSNQNSSMSKLRSSEAQVSEYSFTAPPLTQSAFTIAPQTSQQLVTTDNDSDAITSSMSQGFRLAYSATSASSKSSPSSGLTQSQITSTHTSTRIRTRTWTRYTSFVPNHTTLVSASAASALEGPTSLADSSISIKTIFVSVHDVCGGLHTHRKSPESHNSKTKVTTGHRRHTTRSADLTSSSLRLGSEIPPQETPGGGNTATTLQSFLTAARTPAEPRTSLRSTLTTSEKQTVRTSKRPSRSQSQGVSLCEHPYPKTIRYLSATFISSHRCLILQSICAWHYRLLSSASALPID